MDTNHQLNEEEYISPRVVTVSITPVSPLASSNEGGESGDEHGWT